MTIDLNTMIGILVSVLMTILLTQVRAVRADQKHNSSKLDAHILEITKVLALKVDLAGCGAIRRDCVTLNKTIIADPLDKAIADIEDLRNQAWERQSRENRSIWLAIKSHTHTNTPDREKDKVILVPTNGANGLT